MRDVKVVVYTMAYNAEKSICRAMDSILGQTYPHLEYYVLDNGSTDRTWEIIKDYASRDPRVFPLNIEKNDPAHGGLLLNVLSYASSADYFVWLDADDSHSLDFLEKVLPFAEEEHLDIACCGYDTIDGPTGKLLKRRAPSENIILWGDAFADRFADYRSFMMALWGKVYSMPFLRRSQREVCYRGTYHMYADAMGVQTMFRKADRVGVYAEALHRYYRYPWSISRVDPKDNIRRCQQYILSARDYLEYYGPISRTNEDFLYAVYLSMVDDTAGGIFAADLPSAEKLDLLRLAFREPLWAETLAREADPQFRNLAARKEYVEQMKERILALADTPEEQALAEAAVRELDRPIAGAAT